MSDPDLSQIPTEQLQAMLQQGQPDLSQVPTDQLMGMLQNHPETPDLLHQVGRQLGLTARYGIEGAGNLVGVATDPLTMMLSKATGSQVPKTSTMAAEAANALGLPSPTTPLEQGVAAGSKALVGTGLTAGLGALAGAPALAAQPGMQAASTVGGAVSSDIARQKGSGTVGQILAGILGSLAPAAPGLASLATKASLGVDAAKTADNIAAFEAAGTTPSAGQATQSPILRSIEAMLSKLPGGHGQIVGKAEDQAKEIGQQLTQQADALAPNANPMTAGRTIAQGITGEGGFIDRFKQTTRDLQDNVDQFIPKDTPINLGGTKSALARLVNPVQGAQETSAVLTNPKIQEIAHAVGKDTFGQPGFGALPYQTLKQLRSKVGDMLADSSLISDIPKGQLKQLYAGISSDLNDAARQTSPEALAAANRADNYYRSGLDRIDRLDGIVNQNGGPEAVFQAATSGTREGATTINSVMRSLNPDEANIVTSAVIRRMGRANPSAQNDVGDVFSTERFLTNWNGMSPQAKSALFARGGKDFSDNMDQIAKVASNLREGSSVYRNPSGTSAATAAASTGAAAILSLVTGNLGTAAGLGAGVGAANLGGRLMTNPTFVSWLAKQTTKPIGALPSQVSILANQGKDDPDIQAAIKAMSQ